MRQPRRGTQVKGKRGATRTHAQPLLGGEQGEDGEHWTLTGVSTVAPGWEYVHLSIPDLDDIRRHHRRALMPRQPGRQHGPQLVQRVGHQHAG